MIIVTPSRVHVRVPKTTDVRKEFQIQHNDQQRFQAQRNERDVSRRRALQLMTGLGLVAVIPLLRSNKVLAVPGHTEVKGVSPLIRQTPGSTVSEAFVAEVDAALKRLPERIHDSLHRDGYKVVIARYLTDAFPQLRGVKPRGWPEGSTWDNCDALFEPGSKTVGIAEYYYADTEHRRSIRNFRVPGVTNHEVGHAVDDHQGYLSARTSFQRQHRQDVSRMDPVVKERLYYYIQADSRGEPSEGGRQEACAEVVGALHGGGCQPQGDIEQHFSRTKDVVTEALKNYQPVSRPTLAFNPNRIRVETHGDIWRQLAQSDKNAKPLWVRG
jgi:hypothetical protein